jgi:hypothetical protein
MEITYSTEDDSIKVKLVYIVNRRFHNYEGIGKSWPKHTQCLMFINGLIAGYGEVVKHEKDEDNQKYAYLLATKKVMDKIQLKFIRKEIWEKVKDKINEGNF